MQHEKISEHGTMFTFTAPGGWPYRCYLIRGEQNDYLVDTGCGSEDGQALRAYWQGLERPKPLWVINTHSHWDHIWGNSVFADCAIIAQQLCYETCVASFEAVWNKQKRNAKGSVALCPPNLLFDARLEFPHDGLLLFHSPGHTADGLCLLDRRDNVLYAGDQIGDSVEEPIPWLTCPRTAYAAALRDLQQLEFQTLVSGHNGVLDKRFLQKIQAALQAQPV